MPWFIFIIVYFNICKIILQGKTEVLTQESGCPISDKLNALTVGPRGPMLMQDLVYMEEMAHFDRWTSSKEIWNLLISYLIAILFFKCKVKYAVSLCT